MRFLLLAVLGSLLTTACSRNLTSSASDDSITPPSGNIMADEVILEPGLGFQSPTSEPSPSGRSSDPGYSAQAIARWDVVPYQTFNSDFRIGVLAFHVNEIDRVEFSVEGGPWIASDHMSLNLDTNIVEYTARLEINDFPTDGRIEIRAVAIPKIGRARVLPSLFLYTNLQNTLSGQKIWVSESGNDATGNGSEANPYRHILKAVENAPGGSSIYLTPGTHEFTDRSIGFNNNERWITIEAAPGALRSEVILKPGGRNLRVSRLAVSNVTIRAEVGWEFYGSGSYQPTSAFWLNESDVYSPVPQNSPDEIGAVISASSWNYQTSITNTTIRDYPGRGSVSDGLLRNLRIFNLTNDAIDNPGIAINIEAWDIEAFRPENHIDAIQWFAENPGQSQDMNSIVYGMKAWDIHGQLIFSERSNNLAVVSYASSPAQTYDSFPASNQLQGNHIVVLHVASPATPLHIANDQWTANVKVANSIVGYFFPGNSEKVTIENCHIIDPANHGLGLPGFGSFSSGDPLFRAPLVSDSGGFYTNPHADFDLLPNSPLRSVNTHSYIWYSTIGAFE